MRCPFCNAEDTQVKDSRSSEDGNAIRRRRYCPECDSRFTTFERVQLRELTVLKRNGEKKPFDRDKLSRAINIAMRKRPFSSEQIEEIVTDITRFLETSGDQEIPSDKIGQAIMEKLAKVDRVAYIRFASVYKDFREPEDFENFVDAIKQ